MSKTRMVVDTANLLFRVASAQGKYGPSGTPEEKAGLAMHVALNTLNKYYKQFRPDEVAVTFEGAKNWRKDYTKSETCKSGRVYKANRQKDPSMIPFFELIKSFEELARQHTSLICLSNDRLEGDDLFGGYVQRYSTQEHIEQGDKTIGISGDRDFVQLLKHSNFVLINPDDGKPRTVDDPEFFMFEKCFRGDPGDNVMSALPRVRKDRLIRSLNDEYEMTKLMNETWTYVDPETKVEKVHLVSDLFLENELLMHLEKQPTDIRALIEETIQYESTNHGKFSHFQFVKFCGKFGLKQIAENAQNFADMFGTTGRKNSPSSEKIEQAVAGKSPLIKMF